VFKKLGSWGEKKSKGAEWGAEGAESVVNQKYIVQIPYFRIWNDPWTSSSQWMLK